MTELVLNYLCKKGYTSRQIAEKYKVSKTTVLKWAEKFNIKFVNSFYNPNTINPTVVKKLVRKGYSNKEIAKLLNSNVGNIKCIKVRHNYKYISKNKNLTLSDLNTVELEILIGSLLGDGSISKDGRFFCTHSSAQEEYCKWKSEQLKLYNTKFNSNISRFDKRTNKTYFSCTFYTRGNNEFFKNLRKNIYQESKQITDELLKLYTARSLAIHYMDDGYKRSSSYCICTESFDKKSLEKYIEYCKNNFNIIFKIDNRNRLYLPFIFKKQFEKLIKPYIHSTLKYKLHCL